MSFAFDTNVLIYAVGHGDQRHDEAKKLVKAAFLSDGIVPVQVLAEFTNVCRRKRLLLPGPTAERVAEWRTMFTVPPTQVDDVEAAADLCVRFKVAFFDALIVAVARSAGATILFSEDMQDGMSFDGLRIADPFKPANAATVAAAVG